MVSLNRILEASFKAPAWELAWTVEKAAEKLSEEREKGEGEFFKVEGGLVKIPARGGMFVVGDLHGDMESLSLILERSGFVEQAERGEQVYLVFLGDYGDRGPHSPEIYYVICWLKAEFPGRVILLRGNHEPPADLTPMPYDLPFQLQAKYGDKWEEPYGEILELHELLPHVALVEGKYLLVHGGVPSKAKTLEDLAYAHRKHPLESHLEEILWSDPDDLLDGTAPSPRGAGLLFGPKVTAKILSLVGAKTLIRGHEPTPLGVHASQQGLTLTLFSRKGPPYFNEQAAYLKIDLEKPALNAYQLASQAAVTF
ncbi:serine/threonine protein phosphatase [Candidatus Bathyarchaeota archaeon]|nr:MAG: serine/threonine protein phosphatase [Candidatus Bathyarchaeota archaeon]